MKDKKIETPSTPPLRPKEEYDFHPDAAIKKFLTEISHPRLIAMINEILKTDYPMDSQVSFAATEYFSALGHLDKGSVRGDIVANIHGKEHNETTNKLIIELQTTVDSSMGFRMFVYSLNVADEEEEQRYIFPKGLILYTLLHKPERGFEEVHLQLEKFRVGEQSFSAKNGDLLTVEFPFYNVLATDFNKFQGTPLEMLQVLWPYRYRKNPKLLTKQGEIEKVFLPLNQFVTEIEGQDQLVLCDVFAALVRDVEKICDKQNYSKELDVLTGLNLTYGEYLRAEAFEEGIELGIEQGIEQGQLLRTLALAKSLLDVLDFKTIAFKTGLSLEEVEKLALEEEKLADEN